MRKGSVFGGGYEKEFSHLVVVALQLLHFFSSSLLKIDLFQSLSDVALASLFIPAKFNRD